MSNSGRAAEFMQAWGNGHLMPHNDLDRGETLADLGERTQHWVDEHIWATL